MSDFADWLVGLIKDLFLAIWDFLLDVVLYIFGLFLTAITQTFELIIVPCFMSAGSALSLTAAFYKVPGYVWFFAGHLDLTGCFKILSCAIIFVFARKLVTLFQW